MQLISRIPPGVIVGVLLVVITSLLFFAFLPYRRRHYPAVLLITAIGFAIGQGWDFVGLPATRIGEANLLPALVFAFLMQPLARFVPRPGAVGPEPPASREDAQP